MVGEVELAWWFCERPLIAVTGTNGKSTTTELIAAALHAGGVSAVACGNLGTPFSDIVLENRQERYIVLEISSFQLEGIETFKPYVAVYLNFAADHMDRYDSLDAYRQAKERIFFNQTPREHAIVNARCEMGATRARKKTFDAMGGDADYAFRHGYLYACGHAVLEQSRTRLSGPHNAENQMAALAAADICGVGRDAVIRALCEYRPLPHRCEIVRTHHGVVYIDDSKATNLHAMENALLGQNRPVILIAGGKDKGLPLEPLCDVVKEKARLVLLIGEAKERFMRAWEHATECRLCGSLQEAVKSASLMAREGDVVLLSPGCSSYDMFRDFEERGEVFRREVERL
jgi:UDP-N-acetylmuramoylalanine--D-glutamate ligase